MSKNYYNSFANNADEELVENEEKVIEPAKEELTVEEPKVKKPVVETPVKKEKEIKVEAKPKKRIGKVVMRINNNTAMVAYNGFNYTINTTAKFGEEIEF